MKKFCIKVTLIFAPLILVCCYVFLPLLAAREYLSIEKIADDFTSGKIKIYGQMLVSPTAYNYLRGKQLRQEKDVSVLAFGTSRTLPFSKNIFTNPKDFLNLAINHNNTNDIDDCKIAVENILQYASPKIMIFGLDQWQFNENYLKANNFDLEVNKEYFNLFEFAEYDSDAYFKTYLNNLISFKLNSFKLLQNFSFDKIGLDAVMNCNGVTADGPWYFGDIINNYYTNKLAFDKRFDKHKSFLNNHGDAFIDGSVTDSKSIAIIDSLLNYCKEQNIHVVSYLPPLPDFVNKEIDAPNSTRTYFRKIYSDLKPVFDKYNFELYDYTDVSFLGITDDSFYDGWHISEVSFGKMVVDMLEKGSRLNEYINKDNLQNKIDNAYSIFEYEKQNY